MALAHAMIVFKFFIFLFSISAFAQTQSDGSVAVGATQTAGEASSRPWLSPSGDFAFGFKQLEDKNQFLLSIRYDKIPDQTVAWYLNSIEPVARGSIIRVDSGKGLVLLDPERKELWRADGINSEIDHGFLNDTGNFVLMGKDGSWQWESFRLYSDTMLPSQQLGAGSSLTSRMSETNFSIGRFYLRFLDNGNLVLACNSMPGNSGQGETYYSSQTSDTVNPSNSGSRTIFDSKGFFYVMRNNNQTKQLSPVSISPVSENYYRATLEFDGVFILYSHPRNFIGNPRWRDVWSLPDNICKDLTHPEGTGACGYNSICSLENKRPACYCPIGYSFVDPNDRYGSCKQNFTPACDDEVHESHLVMLEDVDLDWPLSDYQFMDNKTELVCSQSCLQDCLCAVAIFRDNKCWKKKLPLSNGRKDTSQGLKAFIKSGSSYAPPPPNVPTIPGGGSTAPKVKPKLVIVGSVLLGSSLFVNFVLFGALCLGFYLIYRKRKPNIQQNAVALETNLRCFTFKELAEATRGFKEELGSGSFGVVYKGELELRCGIIPVAVKKLNRFAREKEFRAEVDSIGKTNHKNLVRLHGFCDEGQHRLLVYEYMSIGSLASFIFSEEKPRWNIRKQIAIGIARGLLYLHEECSIQIIHCDIKPQNILLDDYKNVRISDFGLAKLLDNDQSKASLTNVRGTKGYLAPEWFRNNQITAKVDVYSFGVLLLEIISCRKCVEKGGMDEEECGIPLTDLVWDCFEDKSLDDFVGNDSEALNDHMMLERFVMIGIWCIQEQSSLRPSMRKVSQMLEGIMEVQIPPCPFPFSRSV